MEGAIYTSATGGEHPITPELLDWQKELLDQRLKDAEEHPEDWVSWDEVRQRLERQIREESPGGDAQRAYQISRKVRRLSR